MTDTDIDQYLAEERARLAAADWHDIPRGHYAIPVSDTDDEDCRDLGYKLFERKVPRTYKNGRTVGRHGWRRTYLIADRSNREKFFNEVNDDSAYTHASDIAFVLDSLDYCRALFGAVTGRCGCCGKTLTDPDSKMRGIGPECIKGMR